MQSPRSSAGSFLIFYDEGGVRLRVRSLSIWPLTGGRRSGRPGRESGRGRVGQDRTRKWTFRGSLRSGAPRGWCEL